jgi:GNAT superfamily N-acetyltransferase
MVDVRVLRAGDEGVLEHVAEDVFDDEVQPHLASEFLADPRHHLVVAVDDGVVVGMASGVHYVHPDKPRELWINEVGVAATYRGQGVGAFLLEALLALARQLNCRAAWVLTDRGNTAAMRLYAAGGGVAHSPDSVMFEFTLA